MDAVTLRYPAKGDAYLLFGRACNLRSAFAGGLQSDFARNASRTP
jgi:hypothetical protein